MTQIRFPRPLAFVFSGGLARAAGQIGMCEVALELGIFPDLVVGCSTGAINAAVLAKDPTSFGVTARELWTAVAQDKALSSTWRSTLRGLAGSGSSRTQTMLREHIEGVFADTTHQQLELDFFAVCTDLESGHSTTLNDGSVAESLLASAAFPVVMRPKSFRDDVLIDGSVVAGVPVSQAITAGARSVIVFDTGPSEVQEDELAGIGWYEVLALAFTHLVRGQADHDLAIAARSAPIIVISQHEGNPFALRTATDNIEIGRDVASSVLLQFAPEHGKDFRRIAKAGLYGNHDAVVL